MTKYLALDVTFIYVFHADSMERLENLLMSVQHLLRILNTNVYVLEVASNYNGIVKKILNWKVRYEFFEDDDPILYRTHYLNYMLNRVSTPFVAVIDSDVIIPKNQILESVNMLRNEQAYFVLPYRLKFMDTSTILRKMYMKSRNIKILTKNIDKMKMMNPPHPVGGVYFCDLETYRQLGFENEKFYGWGAEDGERFYRWNSSEYRIMEIDGAVFHLSHPRILNSNYQNREQQQIKMRYLNQALNKSENGFYHRQENNRDTL